MIKEIEDANLYIILKSYLNRLDAEEKAKPKGEQRPVPTLSEIAQDIGLSRNAMSNISTNTLRQLTLKTGGKIIAAVRRRGFPMEVSDLVAYRAPKSEASK